VQPIVDPIMGMKIAAPEANPPVMMPVANPRRS